MTFLSSAMRGLERIVAGLTLTAVGFASSGCLKFAWMGQEPKGAEIELLEVMPVDEDEGMPFVPLGLADNSNKDIEKLDDITERKSFKLLAKMCVSGYNNKFDLKSILDLHDLLKEKGYEDGIRPLFQKKIPEFFREEFQRHGGWDIRAVPNTSSDNKGVVNIEIAKTRKTDLRLALTKKEPLDMKLVFIDNIKIPSYQQFKFFQQKRAAKKNEGYMVVTHMQVNEHFYFYTVPAKNLALKYFKKFSKSQKGLENPLVPTGTPDFKKLIPKWRYTSMKQDFVSSHKKFTTFYNKIEYMWAHDLALEFMSRDYDKFHLQGQSITDHIEKQMYIRSYLRTMAESKQPLRVLADVMVPALNLPKSFSAEAAKKMSNLLYEQALRSEYSSIPKPSNLDAFLHSLIKADLDDLNKLADDTIRNNGEKIKDWLKGQPGPKLPRKRKTEPRIVPHYEYRFPLPS